MFIPRGSIRHELGGDLWNSFYSLLNPNTLKKVNDKTRKKTSEAINKEFDQYKSHLLPYARTCFLTIIKALNISKGSEVLMTPINIYPILNVIESLELKVKFIDINLYDYGPDYEFLDYHLSKKPSFFLLTYLFGYVPNLKLITEKCKQYNVPLIEDFSQAIGAKYNDKILGTFGIASFYSASLTKYVDGYNGAFLLHKKYDLNLQNEIENELTLFLDPSPKRIKSIIFKTLIWNFALNRFFFNFFTYPFLYTLKILNKNCFKKIIGPNISFKKDIDLPGYYFENISEIQAKTIYRFLKKLPQLISERRKCFRRFETAYNEIINNKEYSTKIQKINNYKGNVYWQLVLKVKNTQIAQDILFSWGIETGTTNLPNLASEYFFKLPNAIALKNNHIFIPLHSYLKKSDYKKLIIKLFHCGQI